MKWLRLTLRNVLRNRRRALVTLLITQVGTSGILLAGGFGLYTYESLQERTTRDNGHVILAHPNYFAREESRPMELGLAEHRPLREVMEADSRVRLVIPRVRLTGLISNGSKSTIFIGRGVEPRNEFKVTGAFLEVVAGDLLPAAPVSDRDPPVMLGEALARSLDAGVGASLTLMATTSDGVLNAFDVEVVGIHSTGKPELDRRHVLLPLAVAQSLLVTDKVSTLAAFLHETADTDGVAATLKARLGEQVASRTWRDLAHYYAKVRALYNRIFGLLGAIIVLMVFFAVVNTLSMAVVERTREVGTLRALGARPMEIVRGFVSEALVISTLGGALGIALSAALALVLPLFQIEMPPPPGMTAGYPLYIYLSSRLSGCTLVGLSAISVAAAFVVARKTAQKPIVEALSHV
jgi:putative ABC transport system permease protein